MSPALFVCPECSSRSRPVGRGAASSKDGCATCGRPWPSPESLVFHGGQGRTRCVPMSALARASAELLLARINHPDERIGRGLLRHRIRTLGEPEEVARPQVEGELARNLAAALATIDAPGRFALVRDHSGGEEAVGALHLTRPETHPRGEAIAAGLTRAGQHPGSVTMVESLATLAGHRSLPLLHFAFLTIALASLREGAEGVVFFIADRRLERLYRAYGIDFDEALQFDSGPHADGRRVGLYRFDEGNLARVCASLAAVRSSGLGARR